MSIFGRLLGVKSVKQQNNVGKAEGSVTHVKMTSETFNRLTRGYRTVEHGQYLSMRDLKEMGVTTGSDIEIDDNINSEIAYVYENGFVENKNL